MAVSIKKLSNNLHIAMRRRIMAEVRRRAFEKPAHRRTENHFAAAEQLVDNALCEAAKLYPIPVTVTLSRILFQNMLTAGIIQRSKDDIKRYIRYKIFTQLPEGKLIAEVYDALGRGEEVEADKFNVARETVCAFKISDALNIGIYYPLLSEFEHSLYQTLIESFPLLNLVREDFLSLDWSTLEKGIRNIRYRVFKHNPGLKEEIEEAEEILEKGEPIDPAQARSLNEVRQKVLRLITMKNLNEWKLPAFQQQGYFEGINDMIEKCFPFIVHPFFQRFLGDFDCESIEDLQVAYALIKSRLKKKRSETIFKKYKDHKIKASSKDKFSLEDILSRFERYFYARWATGKYYQRIGKELSREELFDIFLTFIIYRERSRERVTAELHRINKTLDYLNEGVIKLNCSWVKKYGMGLFIDLFGVSCEEYIKSVPFWAAKPR